MKDLIEELTNAKLAGIREKLEEQDDQLKEIPTRDEIERMIEKLSSFFVEQVDALRELILSVVNSGKVRGKFMKWTTREHAVSITKKVLRRKVFSYLLLYVNNHTRDTFSNRSNT